jgi:hypothetical protein
MAARDHRLARICSTSPVVSPCPVPPVLACSPETGTPP